MDAPENQTVPNKGRHVLYAARGFSRLFWGLAITTLLAASRAELVLFSFVHVPAYVLGAVWAWWGGVTLREAGESNRVWRRRTGFLLWMIALEIYFAPFVGWWRHHPMVTLYMVNVLALVLAWMLALLFMNLLAAELFRRDGDKGGEIEARIFAASVVVLMLLPFTATVLSALLAVLRYPDTGFAVEMWRILGAVPYWLFLFLSIPCTLTLIMVWKAKSRCFCLLTDSPS